MKKDGLHIDIIEGKRWFKDRKLHREDGPAIEWLDGTKSWYKNGALHREDGPAVEYENGDKEWYIKGEHHRGDGPALEYVIGYKAWFKNGKLHREDGPARVWSDVPAQYWLNDKEYSKSEWLKIKLEIILEKLR